MSDRNDILVGEAYDLQIENGDFLVGRSDMQHVDHILLAHPGEYKEHPQVGVGLSKYVKTTGKEQSLKRSIRVQLNYDGYKNPRIKLSDNLKLKVEV